MPVVRYTNEAVAINAGVFCGSWKEGRGLKVYF